MTVFQNVSSVDFYAVIEHMHAGPKPQDAQDKPSCYPEYERKPRYFGNTTIRIMPDIEITYECPEGSHKVGEFHSHPGGTTFSPDDQKSDCIYVGGPDGKVRRWCKDPNAPGGGTDEPINAPPPPPPPGS
jgi:hypothetical protein